MTILQALNKARASIPPLRPPVWARTGHSQTILGYVIPSPKLQEKGEELNITLEHENERIHSTYLKGSTDVVVYLFHGLGGSIEANYMHRTALLARGLGHHVFLNNHRGCGKGAGLATEPYHSGRADDLSKVIAFGRQMLPHHRHIAVGFSLSANALLLLQAGVRADIQPDAAIAVNGPINLERCSLNLQRGLNRIYDYNFTLDLKRYMRTNRPEDAGNLRLVKDLRDFDARYTAPLGGFRSREDYYQTCSAKPHLKKITLPTVILTAADDPFVSVSDYLEAQLSDCSILHIENSGGHLGYLSRKGKGYERWLDRALGTYLETLTEHL